jgi:hypothetical protein
MVTPMAMDVVKRANAPKLGFHPLLEKMPGMSDFCMLDATFEQVLKHPEGTVVGVARSDEPETYMRQHIKHKDHKNYCNRKPYTLAAEPIGNRRHQQASQVCSGLCRKDNHQCTAKHHCQKRYGS